MINYILKLFGSYKNMLLVERVREIVNNFSYKPGGKFEVFEFFQFAAIKIRYSEPRIDASNFDAPMLPMIADHVIDEHTIKSMPDSELEKYIIYIVVTLIKDLEIHEVKEFLKYKKIHVEHPHPELL